MKSIHPILIELHKYLEDNKITQKDFARDLGTTPETLSKMMTGGRPVTETKINAIKFLMKMDISTTNRKKAESGIINQALDVMQSWPPSLQAKGLSAILEIDEQYQREKNKAASSGDPGELLSERAV